MGGQALEGVLDLAQIWAQHEQEAKEWVMARRREESQEDLDSTIRDDLGGEWTGAAELVDDDLSAATDLYDDATERGFAAGPGRTRLIPTGPPTFAWLVGTSGEYFGRLLRLDPEGVLVGRDSRCDLIVNDDAVSALHAKIRSEREEDGRKVYFILDLDSKNHTLVNGEQVEKSDLADGDRIKIGESRFVFKQI